jgi:hypothetical protein
MHWPQKKKIDQTCSFFALQYPLSDKIVSPASNPNYYSRLVASLEAQKTAGKGGPFARFFGSKQ